ncbi:MAG: metallophosphoesterase [Phycisphaerae bacterium]|nr:metallophosphoesterase [Phycisphaerae bacterium]
MTSWAAAPVAADPTVFAVIGDFGANTAGESSVATMVKSWNPAFVVTTGDNNYSSGSATTIDQNIGKYYQEFIGNYPGTYGPGAGNGPGQNRFFPILGNHDWGTAGATPYLNYFTLPGNGLANSSGNERYYDFVAGNVHFFMYDSNSIEPDGRMLGSVQANWLQSRLASSTSTWNMVFLHHPPYSSSTGHGSQPDVQLPFQEWGADAVFSGHDHTYERILLNGLPYFVDGTGGAGLAGYDFGTPVIGSQARYNANYGAMRVAVDGGTATFEFWSVAGGGQLIDTYTTTVPEPATLALLAAGGIALVGRAKRGRRA